MRKLKIYISPYRTNAYLVAYDMGLRRVVEKRTITSAKKLNKSITAMMKKYMQQYRVIYR